jgi:hypothetical protein
VKITALLADAVTVAENRLYMQGGGWRVAPATSLPAVLPNIGVGIVIDFSEGELSRTRRFALRISDYDGNFVPLGNVAADGLPGEQTSYEIVGELSATTPGNGAVAAATVLLAFNLRQVILAKDTPYEVEIAIDDEVRERLPLAVQLVPANGR